MKARRLITFHLNLRFVFIVMDGDYRYMTLALYVCLCIGYTCLMGSQFEKCEFYYKNRDYYREQRLWCELSDFLCVQIDHATS